VQGVSAKGRGLVGVTNFNSSSANNGTFGVFGNDASSTGSFDAGVRGISSRGTGVYGTSTTGTGVVGVSTFGAGAAFQSTKYVGMFSSSGNNDGINASTTQNSSLSGRGRSGIYAHDDSTDGGRLNVGVAGASINGTGVAAFSQTFVGAAVSGGQDTLLGPFYPALSVTGNGTVDLIDACDSGTNPCHSGVTRAPAVFELTSGGDVFIADKIFTAGSCSTGCSRSSTSGEKRVRFFTPQESLPTVEDFGEARLINGQSYVRIDPAFANTIDPRADYMVFITPEGDSRGVYVTAKTSAGFVVRENQGGRSTFAFSYRIVAKPYGEHPARLQMFTMAVPKPNQPRKSF
jgi:hypothetical protein